MQGHFECLVPPQKSDRGIPFLSLHNQCFNKIVTLPRWSLMARTTAGAGFQNGMLQDCGTHSTREVGLPHSPRDRIPVCGLSLLQLWGWIVKGHLWGLRTIVHTGSPGEHGLAGPSKLGSRASLVVQWLRIHLPMQGIQVQSLLQEDPTRCVGTKPMDHNY